MLRRASRLSANAKASDPAASARESEANEWRYAGFAAPHGWAFVFAFLTQGFDALSRRYSDAFRRNDKNNGAQKTRLRSFCAPVLSSFRPSLNLRPISQTQDSRLGRDRRSGHGSPVCDLCALCVLCGENKTVKPQRSQRSQRTTHTVAQRPSSDTADMNAPIANLDAQRRLSEAPCSASDMEILEALRRVVKSMPQEHRKNVEIIHVALVELVRRYGNTAKIALILFASELVTEPDETPNARTERRGRPSASALATDVARPRSLQ